MDELTHDLSNIYINAELISIVKIKTIIKQYCLDSGILTFHCSIFENITSLYSCLLEDIDYHYGSCEWCVDTILDKDIASEIDLTHTLISKSISTCLTADEFQHLYDLYRSMFDILDDVLKSMHILCQTD